MKEIYEAVFKRNGHFYVCGEVQMATDVIQTLELILQSLDNMDFVQSKECIIQLKKDQRFHQDIFGNTIKHPSILPQLKF